NDSRSERGSRMDRHEHIGAGRIGVDGLRRLLTHPALSRVATFLETPGMDEGYDAINLERVRAIASGDPLPQLPPAAFELRRDKRTVAPAEEPPMSPPEEEPRPARGTRRGAAARPEPTRPVTTARGRPRGRRAA
ncbi:MAG TPA: hypothetical protein VEY67_04170, partial [Candidatus Dormibacteraeota bacterium]|nr:hypothetical protein [Candidatus Dormibacteraeota bacterium]